MKKIEVQKRDRSFSEREPMFVTAFLQEFKSANNTCGIRYDATLPLFKQLSIGSAVAAVKVQVTLSKSANEYEGRAFESYSAIIQLFLKRYVRMTI